MNIDREPEVARHIPADFAPRIARVVAPHDVPVLLHEERVRPRWMHRDVMNAVAHLRVRIGNVLRMQTLVDRLPTLPAVISAECARGRDRNEDSLRIFWIEQNRMQTHSARARLPLRSGAVPAQSRELFPILA